MQTNADEDVRSMAKFVPFLSEDAIERDATALLGEFAHTRGVIIAPPIPIEDIVEKYLKLRIEFDDTHKLLNVPRNPDFGADILGAIFFDERRIVIDSDEWGFLFFHHVVRTSRAAAPHPVEWRGERPHRSLSTIFL